MQCLDEFGGKGRGGVSWFGDIKAPDRKVWESQGECFHEVSLMTDCARF